MKFKASAQLYYLGKKVGYRYENENSESYFDLISPSSTFKDNLYRLGHVFFTPTGNLPKIILCSKIFTMQEKEAKFKLVWRKTVEKNVETTTIIEKRFVSEEDFEQLRQNLISASLFNESLEFKYIGANYVHSSYVNLNNLAVKTTYKSYLNKMLMNLSEKSLWFSEYKIWRDNNKTWVTVFENRCNSSDDLDNYRDKLKRLNLPFVSDRDLSSHRFFVLKDTGEICCYGASVKNIIEQSDMISFDSLISCIKDSIIPEGLRKFDIQDSVDIIYEESDNKVLFKIEIYGILEDIPYDFYEKSIYEIFEDFYDRKESGLTNISVERNENSEIKIVLKGYLKK